MKQIKGTANWYDDPGKYFDPTNTDVNDSENKQLDLVNLKNNTLDANTIIVSVSDDNSGSGYTISGSSTGVLLSPITINYADPVDRRGLPIFASTTNNGLYYDEGGTDNVCRIDVINSESDTEFVTNDGHIVYAKFHDGADFGGTGEGTDVYARLYANNVAITGAAISGAINNIYFIYPVRKRLSDMEEHEWLRTNFVSSWEGDVELIEDIQNLWGYAGATNNLDSTTGTWNNASASYLLQADPSDLKTAIDAINDGVGNRLFSEENYITNGDSITRALDVVDQKLQDLADDITVGVGKKYVESVSSTISKNVAHTLPYSITYTPEATGGHEGRNMDIFVDGQLIAADTGSGGANADRDYAETSTTQVTFRFDIQEGRNITYIVRQ